MEHQAVRYGKGSVSQALWQHHNPESTRMYEFKRLIERKYGVRLPDYEALRQWSIQYLNDFWRNVWDFTGIVAETPSTQAVDDHAAMYPRPAFFPGAKLNFAENLLYPTCKPDENDSAILAASEDSREQVTWKQLRERVRDCASILASLEVHKGDRVAGYVANHTDAVVAMLGTTTIGAIWTAVSPDTGIHAVLDRMQQIEPVVLFADNAAKYNGKVHEVHGKLKQIVPNLPTLRAVLIFETVRDLDFQIDDISVPSGSAGLYNHFRSSQPRVTQVAFKQFEADHPVYILYSSGTTGKPKCMVHGAIGTLIQHKKEHDLQCDIRPGPLDVNGIGEMAMPRLIEELKISHFGTSAKYLSVLEQKNIMPTGRVSLQSLKSIFSTGSPLAPSTYEYVYRAFGLDINLASITGGTDIVSLFGTPCPMAPVFAGEVQVRGLGMAVEAWDHHGKDITNYGEPGELVCVRPFPCQPVAFWGEDGPDKYKSSYFETFPGVWHHGDFVKINPVTGGLIMLGRSDGVLKPAGVRFGSSEIYNVLLMHFPEIEDALCVGRRREADKDEVVVLFIKTNSEKAFSEQLIQRVKDTIRRELSARHVPWVVDQCPEIPVTTNGKK
ncbi:MAG: hypothetical protein Q9197_006690 [Variospora fuerteventurae]